MSVIQQRQGIAREICRCLDHMLLAWETCEPIGNPERDDCLISEVRKLQRTYRLPDPDTTTNLWLNQNDVAFDMAFTTGLLPNEGRRLWRRLEAMIYPESLGATGAVTNLSEFTQAVEDFRAWLEAWYNLADQSIGHDPCEWDRRVRFEESASTIHLDGVRHQMKNPKFFKLIQALVVAAKRGTPYVRQQELSEAIGGSSEKTVSRLIKSLPTPWCDFVKSESSLGIFLVLQPRNVAPPA